MFHREASQSVIITLNGSETFTDVYSTKTFASNDSFLHIRCYITGKWHVIAANGDITDA